MEVKEFRRQPLYFHGPDSKEIIGAIGEERYYFIMTGLLKTLFQEPSLDIQRKVFGSMAWELYNQPWEAREAGYDDLDILYSLAKIQEWTSEFGLILGKEIEGIHRGNKIPTINQQEKYKTWEELVELTHSWISEGNLIGMAHGAFDPTHSGHSHMLSAAWPYCDKMVVGFDPNWILKNRKGEDRPRFNLSWRMWEMASLPTVDAVFVLPLYHDNGSEFQEIYKSLGIGVLACGGDNQYLGEYRKRMKELGGRVVVLNSISYSSTRLMHELNDPEISRIAVTSIDAIERMSAADGYRAEQYGYLKDYPGKTNSRPSVSRIRRA